MNPPILIPLGQLLASPTNPRQTFDQEKLRELAANMADPEVGQLVALIVRPVWCQGCKSKAQIDAARAKIGDEGMDAEAARRMAKIRTFEVVDGERRRRAAEIANIPELRAEVRELTDSVVISIQLITYLQKEGLTPIEEARGFHDLLKLRNEDNDPMHTRESIAKSVGRDPTYVHVRLKLLKLPETALRALEEDRIGVRLATLIARIPDTQDRENAARAIVSPARLGGEPMTTREAAHFIDENFMQELKGAPFDTADETLPGPENGKPQACTNCPHRTGNNKAMFGDVKRGDICTKPACYRGKCKAVFTRVSSAEARIPGSKVIVDEAEATAVFSAHDGISLPYDSAFVDLHEKPAETFVSSAVDRTKLPTWDKLVAGLDVPRTIVQDRSGRMRTLVNRNLAIAAAKENGEDIFVSGLGGRAPAANAGETAARKKAEAEQKRQLAVGVAASTALRRAIVKRGVLETKAVPAALLDLAIAAAGADGVWFALKALDVKKGVDQTSEQAYAKAIMKTTEPKEMLALAVELLYARGLRVNGVDKSPEFVALCAAYGIDLKALKAETIAGLKVSKGDVTLDPKTLEQWVKAHLKGMTVEAIAKSYGVPIADVKGALAGGAKKLGEPAFGRRESGRRVEFATRADAEADRRAEGKKPGFEDYSTRIEKDGRTFTLIYERTAAGKKGGAR